jgi:hypothetical protein
MATKQLAGEPADASDDAWYLEYGARLAGLFGYSGDADDQPRDDFPMASVARRSAAEYRTIAVGRPRALWVLYPHAGGETLCRGAVAPYFEFDSSASISDSQWRESVRARKTPSQPDWLRPLTRSGSTDKPAKAN